MALINLDAHFVYNAIQGHIYCNVQHVGPIVKHASDFIQHLEVDDAAHHLAVDGSQSLMLEIHPITPAATGWGLQPMWEDHF